LNMDRVTRLRKSRHRGMAVWLLCAAVLGLSLSCQSMGRQFAARPFPKGLAVYLELGIQGLHGEDSLFVDDELLPLWIDTLSSALKLRGFQLVDSPEQADFRLFMRGGRTSTRRVAGFPLLFVGFRLQMLETAKGRTVFNQWFEVGSQLGERKLSYKDAVLAFTQDAVASLPMRLE